MVLFLVGVIRTDCLLILVAVMLPASDPGGQKSVAKQQGVTPLARRPSISTIRAFIFVLSSTNDVYLPLLQFSMLHHLERRACLGTIVQLQKFLYFCSAL